jgi:cation transport ATPase
MLQQILIHTPVYVWVILAVLVWRGSSALRAREMTIRSLFIVPAIMLALSLQDIVMKFGSNAAPLSAWAMAAAATALLVWKFGAERTVAGAAPGSVRLRGSWMPLAMMMAVFFTKYAASVLLAILPHARQDALFATGVCLLFGAFNGCFLGRLARDLAASRGVPMRAQALVSEA